ncbi:MBL fold metallo-hydrolase [Candidatus Dependentiae bacterium]|nr:MBL fold metallo-hydrolase [Candidatus Dependentiae bacterium]
MKITFLGAVEGVTGSRYLVEHENIKILVDCGMFQGSQEITQSNSDPFPVDPESIDAVIVTHAHIDHTGYIPVLVKNGFRGKIYCSKGTYALCSLMLVDSGSLQERGAIKFNQRGGPDHPPAVALYTARDAENALKFFNPVDYDTVIDIGTSLKVTLVRSGHILGSSFVIVSDGKQKLTFSGDLGRPQQFMLKAPPALKQTDFLVIESTYGDRLHPQDDPIKIIGDIVNATIAKGGVIIIPCFVIGRTETILYCLHQLKQKNMIPDIPIFLDSPMAIHVANFSCDFKEEYELSSDLCKDIFTLATYTLTAEESKKIDRIEQPAIIIAGSGMADGGRVLFHLKRFISDAKNTVLFVGFQAEGTTGHALVNGEKLIKIDDEYYTVQADIRVLDSLSAHADYDEILKWVGHFENRPKKVFVTHGEKPAAEALKNKIEERFGGTVIVPKYLESFDLD